MGSNAKELAKKWKDSAYIAKDAFKKAGLPGFIFSQQNAEQQAERAEQAGEHGEELVESLYEKVEKRIEKWAEKQKHTGSESQQQMLASTEQSRDTILVATVAAFGGVVGFAIAMARTSRSKSESSQPLLSC